MERSNRADPQLHRPAQDQSLPLVNQPMMYKAASAARIAIPTIHALRRENGEHLVVSDGGEGPLTTARPFLLIVLANHSCRGDLTDGAS